MISDNVPVFHGLDTLIHHYCKHPLRPSLNSCTNHPAAHLDTNLQIRLDSSLVNVAKLSPKFVNATEMLSPSPSINTCYSHPNNNNNNSASQISSTSSAPVSLNCNISTDDLHWLVLVNLILFFFVGISEHF